MPEGDTIARAAESDVAIASELLEPSQGVVAVEDDWPDQLATLLRLRANVRLTDWAETMDLAPATVSRG